MKIILNKIKRKLGIAILYPSETSKVRSYVIEYCTGKGCDIGFGGDKIKKTDCIGIDYAQPYAHTGKDKVDIACDVMNEPIPIDSNTFDYVYSSHLIEDFKDTKSALIEFIRILKNNGNLILVFPDQRKYEENCKKNSQPLNMSHVHKEMGLIFMQNALDEIKSVSYSVLYSSNCEIDYNVILALKINKINENKK